MERFLRRLEKIRLGKRLKSIRFEKVLPELSDYLSEINTSGGARGGGGINQICHYVSEHNIMLKNQHAYRINQSTESALLHLTDSCLENMENGMLTGAACFVDFSAAFDLIY
jgi:hypothetical protein